MTPFNNFLYLNNDHSGLGENDDHHASSEMYPTIEESSFYSNFQCCGRSLKDLHELLHHYEQSHVRIEDGEDEASPSGGFDFDTVIAADSLLNVGAEVSGRGYTSRYDVSTHSHSSAGFRASTSSSSLSRSPAFKKPESNSLSNSTGKRSRVLTLGIEPCDFANDDSDHLSAFDNTVIRPMDSNSFYGSQSMYAGQHGYPRIAPKRSQSVPTLSDIPFIQGESGFKLIHSILSSTVDPPSGDKGNSHVLSTHSNNHNNSMMSNSSSASSTSNNYHNSFLSSNRGMGSDRPFVCPVGGCGKTYKNANGLKYHAIHGHDGVLVEKPHKCPYSGCGKRYKNTNGLKYHFQHAHPNSVPPPGITSSYCSQTPLPTQPHVQKPSYNIVQNRTNLQHAPVRNIPQQSTSTPPNTQTHFPTYTSSQQPQRINTTTSMPPPSLMSTNQPDALSNSSNSSAPATIANILKQNPMMKQHLPGILRNLQHLAHQKNINSDNLDNTKKQ